MHKRLEETVFAITGHQNVKVVGHDAVRNRFEAEANRQLQKLRRERTDPA